MQGYVSPTALRATNQQFDYLLDGAQAKPLRKMSEFAEQELVLPSGPFAGRRFTMDRQPFSRLWFGAVDSGLWQRYMAVGPTQTGKTLLFFVCPTLYHLFEYCETVVCGVPNRDMAMDKWNRDLKPAIERTRYAEFLPKKGPGSQGGNTMVVQFRNGAWLRFMTGGGDDKSVAGFTTRIVVLTELDGMDVASETSREADRVKQIEARAMAYGSRKRVYGECTASIEEGRIWQEYVSGTQSRIALKCIKCGEYVTPEREHLIGWQGAGDVMLAKEQASLFCPECGEAWTEPERRIAHDGAVLVHKGQKIDREGTITGDSPKTDTLGLRWNGANNFMMEMQDIAAAEWTAANAANEDNAEREMLQFYWARPHKPSTITDTPLDAKTLMQRTGPFDRGHVPAEAVYLVAHADVGKWLLHYTVTAFKADFTGWVIDYGVIETKTDQIGVERGILQALRDFRDKCNVGWKSASGMRSPDVHGVDAGYQTKTVYEFIRESGNRWKPLVGRGFGQRDRQHYHAPNANDKNVGYVGERFHFAAQPEYGVLLGFADSDHWKSVTHQRLAVPKGAQGSLVLFQADPREHLAIAKHWTAEKQVEEFDEYRGKVIRWHPIRDANHWLDATYNCCVLGYYCGARLIEEKKPVARAEPSPPVLTMPDGRPFFIMER